MRHGLTATRMETIVQDLRIAGRQMRKNPSFAGAAMAVLALGIAAAVAIFSFVEAALMRPLPYEEPGRLYVLFESNSLGPHFHMSYFDYLDYRQRNSAFQSLDAFVASGFMLQTPQGPQPVHGARVTAGFFRTLGVAPGMGRDFRATDDQPSAPFVTVISYAAWQRRFGSRANILGEHVVLDGNPTTIIGVLARGFHFAPAEPADFWTTERPDRICEKDRGCHNLTGLGRLRPGVSPATARIQFESIGAQLAQSYPNDDHGRGAVLVPLDEEILGDIRPILMALFAGAMLLLLISTVNVASLLLVRSAQRGQEMAIRGALGASRFRLVRQCITEGSVLALFAGAAGVVLAALEKHVLLQLLPKHELATMPYLAQSSLNATVLGFAVLVTVTAAVIFSLLPAVQISFADLRSGLAASNRGSSGLFWRRFGSNMIVAELLMTAVLLVGAGLLAKSLYRLLHSDLGFIPDNVAVLSMSATSEDYKDPARQVSFVRQATTRMAAIPGVRSAAITTILPLGDGGGSSNFKIVGQAWPSDHNEVVFRDVSAGYFSTLKARLLSGRFFDENEDGSHARVAVINRQMADMYFAGQPPIGKQVYFEGDPAPPAEIIGVVEDIQEGQPDSPPRPAMYRPLNQNPQDAKYGFGVVLRTSQDPDSVLPLAASALHGVDASLAVYDPETMAERLSASASASLHRSSAFLVSGFAGLAFLLSAVGLYSVIAYSVSQRTREIGVRMALGAPRGAVQWMVLREAGALTAAGIVLGLAGAVGAARLLGGLLFGVQAWDAATLAAVALVLGVAALVAAYVPARRAAKVDPIEALRTE